MDIGGTYVRFGRDEGGELQAARRYKASDFPSFEDALHHYCKEEGLEPKGKLSIATAGYEEGGVWKFINQITHCIFDCLGVGP